MFVEILLNKKSWVSKVPMTTTCQKVIRAKLFWPIVAAFDDNQMWTFLWPVEQIKDVLTCFFYCSNIFWWTSKIFRGMFPLWQSLSYLFLIYFPKKPKILKCIKKFNIGDLDLKRFFPSKTLNHCFSGAGLKCEGLKIGLQKFNYRRHIHSITR